MSKFRNILHATLVKLGVQKFEATAKLTDGTEIFTTDDEWQTGSPVFTRDENGEPVAVPDGEYTLEDGNILVVVDGLLSELKAVEAEDKEDDDTMMSKVIAAFSEVMEKKFNEFEARFTEMNTKMSEVDQKLSAAATGGVKNTTKKVVDISKMSSTQDRVNAILNNK